MEHEPAGTRYAAARLDEVRLMRRPLLGLAVAGAALAQQVDFEKQIRPILEQKCLPCHDAAKAAGGLRMDTRARVSRSLPKVVAAIDLASDKRGAMPPGGPRLPQTERDSIKAWVAAGPPWPDSIPLKTPQPT